VLRDRQGQDLEARRRILLVAEDGHPDPPGRVVDGTHERQSRAPPLELVMAADIELEELTLGRHVLAPAAMPWRATAAGAGESGRAQDPLEARPADLDRLPLGQELGAASGIVSSPLRTHVRTQPRRCSRAVIVIVVSMAGD